jgi:deazaflavin-dependent oxidoreductase (nitroreductase family)
MPDDAFNEQFLYLTTIGRKSGRERAIEIWFVELDRRLYVLAEHGYTAHWVQNVLASPGVKIRLDTSEWNATGQVLDPAQDGELYASVRQLAREKYGWGDGLPVEFRLEHN